MADEPNSPPAEPTDCLLSDADLLAWAVVPSHRARQARDDIPLLPYPPCPTCGAPVDEAGQVTGDRFAALNIRLTLQPCGHIHETGDDYVRRLWVHIHEMLCDVSSGYRGHAQEARAWTTEDVVREARTRISAAAAECAQPPAASAGPHDRLESLRQHAEDVSRRTGLGVTVEPFETQYAVTVTRPDGMTRHSGYDAATVYGMLLGAAAAHHSAEEDVTRVIELYERWVNAGPPPLGTLINRWWDARLVELHDAIVPPTPRQSTGCRCHNGDELCSGCRRCPAICSGCDGPEYPSTNISGPVVATARIALDAQPGFSDGIVSVEIAASATAGLNAVRDLHRPVEHNGQTICAECSGWGGESTDNSPVPHGQCGTLRAIANARKS